MHKPTSASALQPPVARQEAFVIKSPFGDRTDEYYWLRNDNSEKKPADIMEYLNAEQAYTEAMMARLVPLMLLVVGVLALIRLALSRSVEAWRRDIRVLAAMGVASRHLS
ncbi:MAG: hypothetical protein EBR07_09810 [Planctomycetes bacterium]|nr:hypothetical protein [Planctomycetota bacterium]